MSERLKPCPFCGSEAIVLGSWLNSVYPKSPKFSVSCDGDEQCMGQNQEQGEQVGFCAEYNTEDEAISAWNNQIVLARIAELEAALHDIGWRPDGESNWKAACRRGKRIARAALGGQQPKCMMCGRSGYEQIGLTAEMSKTCAKCGGTGQQ